MTVRPAASETSNLAAVGFVLSATVLMAFQDAVVKLVSGDFPLWQLFVVRSLVAIPMLVAVTLIGPVGIRIRPVRIGWAMLRGMLIVAMYGAFYAALPLLDLGVVAAAYYTGPLFIVLFSAVLIRERLTRMQIGAVLLGFAGVLVILRPGTDAFAAAMLVPILSAVLYACSMVLTRGKCADESPVALSIALNLNFIVVGLVVTGVLAVLDLPQAWATADQFMLGPWIPMGSEEWQVITLLAAVNVLIHVALARAYQRGAASVVASFDYSYLIFAVGWGFVLLAEVPSGWAVAGMVMIAAAGLLVIAGEGRRHG